MTVRRVKSRRRVAREAARQNARWRSVVSVVGFFFVLGGFAAGLGWKAIMSRTSEGRVGVSVASDSAQRLEALSLFDEAVQANHEERMQGAANALVALQRMDHPLPGVDAFVAEMALTRGDIHTVQQAAQASLRRGEKEATSLLLLALEKWINRGQSGDPAGAQNIAEQYLSDAVRAEPSNGAVYFFWGEMSRLAGSEAEARAKLLSGLHREMPWRSSALLAVKQQFAQREARRAGRSSAGAPPDDLANAALSLESSAGSPQVFATKLGDVLNQAPLKVAMLILEDRALIDASTEARASLIPASVGGK